MSDNKTIIPAAEELTDDELDKVSGGKDSEDDGIHYGMYYCRSYIHKGCGGGFLNGKCMLHPGVRSGCRNCKYGIKKVGAAKAGYKCQIGN